MPVDRDYLVAPKSPDTIEDNLMERLDEELERVGEPQTKAFWIKLIREHTKASHNTSLNIFYKFIIQGSLTFLRVYRGHVIYVGPSTPMALHNKMPVIELET